MSEIINRVAKSGLITLDLGEFYPEGERAVIDLKDQLWQEIALKEKDFREWVKSRDWSEFNNKHVCIHCSVDAVIPTWVYMLLSAELSPFAKTIVFGDADTLESRLWSNALVSLDTADFQDARVVVKGCADRPVSPMAFIEVSRKLQPVVKSLMYGEPCSTVPVYKKK